MPESVVVERDGEGADDVTVTSRATLRRYLTISWVLTIVLFTLVRLMVAKETLERYGLNIWAFGAIDLLTAVPYAIGVARVATSLVDRDTGAAGRWGITAAISFIAPYLYVAWAGKDAEFPVAVWWVLAVLMAGFGGNAVWSVRRRVREGRARRLAAATAIS